MPIKTHLTNIIPAKERFKQEITLLSKGYTTPDAFPEGKITIYPWDSTVDDWILANFKKGQSTKAVIWNLVGSGSICNLNGAKVDDMLIGDVLTITLVSRSLKFDSSIKFVPVCSYCGHKHAEDTVKIPNDLEKIGEKPLDYPGYDEIVLPQVQDVVRIRPLKVSDERAISDRSNAQKKQLNDQTASILASIISVGGGTPDSLNDLVNYYHALHPIDQDELRSAVNRITPQLSQTIKYVCDNQECGREFEFELTFDDNFFRKPSARGS